MSPPIQLDTIVDRLMQRPARTVGQAEWRYAAVAAVFRQGDEGAELLFMERARHEADPWSGQISFPGGRAEPEDATLLHTAARETREELGLDLDAEHVTSLGALDELQARARRRILPLAIRPHAFVLHQQDEPFQLASDEVADAFWVPVHHLASPARRTWYDSARAGVPFVFPAVELGRDVPLWGLTHRMVLEVLERVGAVADVDALSLPRTKA